MTTLIIFIAFLMLLSVLILFIKLRQTNIRKALNMPRSTTPNDDSFVQAREIGQFLHQRAEVAGVYFHRTSDGCGIDQRDFSRIQFGEDHAVAQLVRLCHALGCEIVIRQTDTNDLEDRSNTPTVFAEKIISMKARRAGNA